MPCLPAAPAHIHKRYYIMANVSYSKRHNKFLFPALAGAIYGSPCEAKNEISNVVNYSKSLHSVWHFMFLLKTVVKRRYLMRFSTNLVPLRLEPSESASERELSCQICTGLPGRRRSCHDDDLAERDYSGNQLGQLRLDRSGTEDLPEGPPVSGIQRGRSGRYRRPLHLGPQSKTPLQATGYQTCSAAEQRGI